ARAPAGNQVATAPCNVPCSFLFLRELTKPPSSCNVRVVVAEHRNVGGRETYLIAFQTER
ncbi:MAG: hypothetical protein ACREAM_04550, partial [Blastocatellia bacterium]